MTTIGSPLWNGRPAWRMSETQFSAIPEEQTCPLCGSPKGTHYAIAGEAVDGRDPEMVRGFVLVCPQKEDAERMKALMKQAKRAVPNVIAGDAANAILRGQLEKRNPKPAAVMQAVDFFSGREQGLVWVAINLHIPFCYGAICNGVGSLTAGRSALTDVVFDENQALARIGARLVAEPYGFRVVGELKALEKSATEIHDAIVSVCERMERKARLELDKFFASNRWGQDVAGAMRRMYETAAQDTYRLRGEATPASVSTLAAFTARSTSPEERTRRATEIDNEPFNNSEADWQSRGKGSGPMKPKGKRKQKTPIKQAGKRGFHFDE